MKKISEISVEYISVRAKGGGVLDDCIKECIILSLDNLSVVKLKHNSVQYIIDSGNLINSIKS